MKNYPPILCRQDLTEYLISRKPDDRARDAIAAINLILELGPGNHSLSTEQRLTLLKYPGSGATPHLFSGKAVSATQTRIRKELQQLPGEHFEHARNAVINQHHTDPRLAVLLWIALQKLGFKGGTILDPGCSIGLIEEYMPVELRDCTQAIGVELDINSAQMFKLLHPQHTLRRNDLMRFFMPANSVDAAIGNPPFDDSVFAPYNGSKFRVGLAGFSICKAIDFLKPGGLLAMIVGTGNLDNVGKVTNPIVHWRRWVDQRAVFLGAVRCPNGTFGDICVCGTSADVWFLQKRLGTWDDRQSEPFVESLPYEPIVSPKKNKPVLLNEYFFAHPEHLVGTPHLCQLTFDRFATMWTWDKSALFDSIQGAIANLIENKVDLVN